MIIIVYIAWGVLQIIVTALACLAVVLIYKFIGERLQRYYYRWKHKKEICQWEKAWEVVLQQQRRRELYEKEKKKYPLFYLKEGIV